MRKKENDMNTTSKRVNTNTTEFRKKMVEHVLSFQSDESTKEGKVLALKANAEASMAGKKQLGFWNAGIEMTQAGFFLVYHNQIEDFMKNEMGLTNDKYKNEDKNIDARWELYKGLCGKAVRDAIENTNGLFDKAELENMK